MSKEKKAPELWPVNVEGKIQWVKRSQYEKQKASSQAIKLSAAINQSHVTQMVDAILKGTTSSREGASAEAPEEIHTTFDEVLKDYQSALEHEEEELQKAEEAKAEEAQKQKEKAEAEDKMVATVKEGNVGLSDISKVFDTGNLDRCIPKKDVDDATLLGALTAGLKLGEFSNWMIGDLVVALEDRGQLGVVAKLCEATGKKYNAIYASARTCRTVPPEKRTTGVSFTIYSEIAMAKYSDKKEEHEKKMTALIEKAASGEVKSSQDARALRDQARGKTPPAPTLPEEDSKHEFIVVRSDADGNAEALVVAGFPKAAYDDGATVINPKTKKMFMGFRKAAENRWTDLPILPLKEDKKEEEAPAPAKKGKKK